MSSKEIRLVSVPDGLPRLENFAVVEVPTPAAGPGQVLVRNLFFQVSARLRPLLSGATEGTPLPSVRPGDSLPSATVGEVVTAPGGSGLAAGDLVSHWSGWREYAAVPAGACTPLGKVFDDPVVHLGSGWTAYLALTQCADLRPGETVLVTGGTGGVGSLAAQIARQLGAARVIGTTGSPAKADRMVSELGYDVAVVRGQRSIADAAPDGIDVVVDNVGGDELRAAVAAARTGARVSLVGTLASQLSPAGDGATAPVELDTFSLILKGISIRGVGRVDDPAIRSQWQDRFGGWLAGGHVVFPHVRVPGIESAPRALQEVMSGKHIGTVVVEL
ncbi:MDR family NADP-dependent oxidoreductase [Fodinicola acaciae]|uniref:MDR family NADP-dependent oxidoreductase n=1 Tax=Fodinicola acaciae TaxID=2681555 RepID=UPI001C9E3E83|nr:NADP-dependent oxidoreductase [Fodinicola acaciae]